MSTIITTTSFTAALHTSFAYAEEDARLLTGVISDLYRVSPDRIAVTKTPPEVDKTGIDYVARLLGRDTPPITVDVKRSAAGRARYWQSPVNPDVAIELWSVAPDGDRQGVPGPLFRGTPLPHYWAYIFGDIPGQVFMFPAESLRYVAQHQRADWERKYGVKTPKHTIGADGTPYASPFIPVPLSVVSTAVAAHFSF